MKTKRTFKTICSVLSAALLLTSFSVSPVSAAKPEVYMFETMGGSFMLQKGPNANAGGWVGGQVNGFIYKSDNTGFGYLKREGTFAQVTEKSGDVAYNTYLQSGGGNQLAENMFGTVVDSGKLHISYSTMPVSEDNALRIYVNDAGDELEGDGTIKVDGYDKDNQSHVSKNVLFTNNNVWLSEKSDGTEQRENLKVLTANSWYKVDIIYDFDKGNFTAYLNGEKLGTEPFYRYGLKGIHGSYDKESGTSTAWTTSLIKNFALDDFYVHSYEGTEKVHFATEGAKQLTDGSFCIAVSPSEYVEGLVDLVTLTDAATGEEVYCDAIEARADGQLYITLPAECAGMNIVLNADVTEQTTSGATAVEEFVFTIPGENVNQVKEYYFVNDSFDGLELGRAPLTYTSQNAVITAKDAGKAVTLTDGTLTKKLAQSTPVTGDFSVEFDVKRNSAYALDAMLYGADAAKVNLLTAGTDGAVSFAADRSGTLAASTLTSSNAWEHVKIDVDMATEKLNVQMGANTAVHQTTLKGMLAAGISGIKLSGSAEVDNVKIYKNVKYYLYDDFNDMNSNFSKYSYWNRTQTNLSDHIASRGTETSDTLAAVEQEAYDRGIWALKDYYASNGWFDPEVTTGTALDGENADKEHTYFSQTKAFAVTPAAPTNSTLWKSESGTIQQADAAGPGNYWTKEKAAAGDKVLFVGPRLLELRDTNNEGPRVTPKQRRIVKYFDRSISAGTPFTMEFLMKAPDWQDFRVGAFGFSLIEKGQEASNHDNLLFGFSGVATITTDNKTFQNTDNPDHQQAFFAPITDSSLATELESKLEGSEYFKKGDQLLSQGSYLMRGSWGAGDVRETLPVGSQLRKITVTVTPKEDGTTTITYAHEKDASTTITGTVTVPRDFNSKEFVGLAIDTYDLTWINGGDAAKIYDATLIKYWDDSYLKKGNHGMMFDDLKIYETGATNPGGIYIKSIAGADYEYNQIDITGGVSDSARAVAINFSAGVASSSACANGIINLIDAETGEVVETTKDISADGKTVYVIPADGFTGGKSYYLAIDNNLEFSPNNASQFIEPKLYSFNCVEGEAFGIIESNLMDPITKDGVLTYEQLKPARGKTILANALSGQSTRLYVDGFSKVGGENMVAIIGYYTTNNGMDTLVDMQWIPFTSEVGAFTKYFNLSTTENFDEVRAFVWTADGKYKPLVAAVGLTVAVPETTN